MPEHFRWQYQGKAEGFDPIIPSFGWFSQEPDVIRPPHQTDEGFFALGAVPIIPVPSFGWFVQETDVIRPPHQVRPGMSSLVEFDVLPKIDWLVTPPDVIRPPHQTRPGLFALVEFDVLAKIDWLVEPADVIRPPHQVRPGLSVLGAVPIIPPPDFGWFVQETDVVRPPHQVRPGFYVLGQPPIIPVVPSSISDVIAGGQLYQYQAKAEPLEQPAPAPDFGWFVQETDVIRPEHQVRPGFFFLGEVPIIPDFDWFVPPADVIQPLPRPEGLFVRGPDPTEFALVPDLVPGSQPDVIRPPHQVQPGFFVLGAVPIIPAFDWFLQQSDVIRPPHAVRPGFSALVEFNVPEPPAEPPAEEEEVTVILDTDVIIGRDRMVGY